MNLQKITEFYPWDDNASRGGDEADSIHGQFTLCLDRISGSGEFAFVYILLNLVKRGVYVKLIVANHSKIHYTSIFRKNVSAYQLQPQHTLPLLTAQPHTHYMQNLDISKLEQSGKLEMVQLSGETEAGSFGWQELQRWQHTVLSPTTDSKLPTAVLFDDLDMLELLAPSPEAARGLVTHFIASLNSSRRALSHVVAFGRHPVETTAQLSSLGAAGSSAKGSGVVATNRYLFGQKLLSMLFLWFS